MHWTISDYSFPCLNVENKGNNTAGRLNGLYRQKNALRLGAARAVALLHVSTGQMTYDRVDYAARTSPNRMPEMKYMTELESYENGE